MLNWINKYKFEKLLPSQYSCLKLTGRDWMTKLKSQASKEKWEFEILNNIIILRNNGEDPKTWVWLATKLKRVKELDNIWIQVSNNFCFIN